MASKNQAYSCRRPGANDNCHGKHHLSSWRGSGRFVMICPQPANDNILPDHPLRLEDAIKYGFPSGGMTVSGLRREAARGRLIIERIANKDFTSLRNIEEMRKLCRVKNNLPVSGSVPQVKIASPSGSSSTT